jgi:hypothetical protein
LNRDSTFLNDITEAATGADAEGDTVYLHWQRRKSIGAAG